MLGAMRGEDGRKRRRTCGVGLALLLLGTAPDAGAEPGPAEDAAPGRPPVALDALFKLPSATPPSSTAPANEADSRREWLERFDAARGELERARARLAATQSELEELAANTQSWQVAAPGATPGAGGENGPLSFKLRQQIRRDREAVAEAERGLTDLRVEADLAGVPPEWLGETPVPDPNVPSPSDGL